MRSTTWRSRPPPAAWCSARRKASLRLEKRSDKPLAQAIDQVVAQYLQGVDGRPVSPGRDLLAIVMDTAASNPVRDHLRTAVSRTATQPPGTLLGHSSPKAKTRR